MLLQAYFEWIETAAAAERAQAVAALARAYLKGVHGAERPEEIEAALTLALDDPSPLVRRALACTLADKPNAPRALVLSLARDQAEISGLLLVSSPLLTEADLIDLATHAERLALSAIALRPGVPLRVSGAIVARGEPDATHALLVNGYAEVAPAHLIEVAARSSEDPRIRAALLSRADLPAPARHLLMRSTASALKDFLGQGGFLAPARLDRLTAEAMEGGTLTIAARAGETLPAFIDHLRQDAQLTPSLLLRAALCADIAFVGTALAELCELPATRVLTMLQGGSEPALGALVRKAGLPEFLHRALIAALATAARVPPAERGTGLNLAVIRAAQSAQLQAENEDSLRLLALLRRYEAESARAAARLLAESLRPRREIPLAVLAPVPALEDGTLRLAGFAGDAALPVMPAADVDQPPRAVPADDSDLFAPASGPAEPPAPPRLDLATLVAQWKAEHRERDAAAPSARAPRNENAGRNEKAA